ncbi:MAG TPA: hypothetical protein DCY07_04820 [Rhodospirillaceae bacterium]|nr:hypothetical protein [Rhodospirillaceae bacterium]
MKIGHLALVIALSAVTAFGVTKYTPQAATTVAPTKESAFERMMKTNTLRCAYLLMPPQLSRDPNSGQFSGVAYDITTEIAKRLDLKVEWTEEVTFMTVAEGMKAGRYDAFCLTAYRWAPGTRAMEYTTPLFYSTTSAYVRTDDHRFDTDLSLINDPSVTMATIDGEASTFIRAADYPKSTAYSMPVSTDPALLLETIATKKADVALSNPLMVMPYLVANPNVLRRVETPAPLRIYSHALSFAKGEHDLLSMFNIVIEEMIVDGTMDRILDPYEKIPNSFVRLKSPIASR